MEMKDKFQLVGTKIQEFSLKNSRGDTVNIRDLEGKKKVVIILFRDINWPYCRWHTAELRKDYDRFIELDAFLYPILADKEENAIKLEQKYARNKYPIFFDKSKEVPKMLKQEVKLLKLGRMPGMLIIDKQGIIQFAYYSDSMSDIPENEEVLEILKKIE